MENHQWKLPSLKSIPNLQKFVFFPDFSLTMATHGGERGLVVKALDFY